ncbi:MAG: hypothetical protein ACR2Q3_04425 [Woeseiaceae bacterium]
MTEEVTSWAALREFKHTDLTQSFVLSWEVSSDLLQIDVDLYLCPDHPFYEAPRPAEKACFRPAHIEFPHCSKILASLQDQDVSPAKAIHALGGGLINDLRRTGEGEYEISGEFGQLTIFAERPMVRLKDRRT